MPIEFLNVDLELLSSEDLTPLVNAFGSSVVTLGYGPENAHHQAAFETPAEYGKPDPHIQYFCDLIEKLDGAGKEAWERSHTKSFNIGYASGNHPYYIESELHADTIVRMAKIGTSVKITVYKVANDASG